MVTAATGTPTAIVTGASAGIGRHTALGLARAGLRVVMVGRSAVRLEAARRFVHDQVPAAEAETEIADFSALDAVRDLAARLLDRYPRIDVLVNNAALNSPRYAVSAEGYELVLAVNHLAPFLLTNLLLDRMRSSAPARIVTVASQAHHGARIEPATLAHPPNWTPLGAYRRSKLANILFTRALAKRLEPATVTACCLHPGVIATSIGDRIGFPMSLAWRLAKPFLAGADKGARTPIFLATVGDPMPFHGAYVIGESVVEPDAAARDDRLAEALWQESARLVGL
ncbi:MAG TPA: SDR family NAD(P)-dependent oxidoreductase [Stellaceae bacterium]|nr:SDR family NAD(P)-dependent oxidoreductase [Stellaceae bacterium]